MADNPISPKEMWIPCLSLIKNNFGKESINTFPATRETRGRKEVVEEGVANGREGKKREKFDDIWKCVSVCALWVALSHSHGLIQ